MATTKRTPLEQPAGTATPGAAFPLYFGNVFDTLEQGNPMGGYDTHLKPNIGSPVWNSAVAGAMKRQRTRKPKSSVQAKL